MSRINEAATDEITYYGQPWAHILLSREGRIANVFGDITAARNERDKRNADPVTALGKPDTDAPYSLQSWLVDQEGVAK